MIAVAERWLVAAVLCFLAYLYVDRLQEKAATAEQALATARLDIADRDRTITALSGIAQRKELLATRMEGERNLIRAQLGTREIQMRKLQDDNAEVRAWAAAAVPGPVAGLREHPTFTGAAAYRQFLSTGAALPAARRAGDE